MAENNNGKKLFPRKSLTDLMAQCEGSSDLGTALKRENGDGGPNRGNKRNLDENIRIAKARMEEDKDDNAQKEWDKRVDKAIEALNAQMDKKCSDSIEIGPDNKLNGYMISFNREPVPGGSAEVKINGRKAFVHETVEGDSVAHFGSRTEISCDMIEKAADRMMETGTSSWERYLDDGTQVEIGMSLSAGKGTVRVAKDLKDGETRTSPGGLAVSGDIWEGAYAKMQETGRSRYATTLPGGDVVSLFYAVEIDGRAASIDRDEDAAHVNPDAHNPSVSGSKWDSMYAKMRKSGKSMFSETLPDGTIVTARLVVKVNDKYASIDDSLPPHTVKDRLPVTEIARRQWQQLKEQAVSSPDGRCSVTLSDGRKVTGNLTLKADGERAYANTPMGADEVREERGFSVISKEMYDGLIAEMEKDHSTIMEKENKDGKTIRVKRESTMEAVYIEPNGKKEVFKDTEEPGRAGLRDAIGEVAGFNDELGVPRKIFGIPEREVGETLSEMMKQGKLQATRSIAMGGMSVPGKVKGGVKTQAREGQQAMLSAGRGWFGKLIQAGLIR